MSRALRHRGDGYRPGHVVPVVEKGGRGKGGGWGGRVPGVDRVRLCRAAPGMPGGLQESPGLQESRAAEGFAAQALA